MRRTVWLFGRPYWWDAQPGQPLTLRSAHDALSRWWALHG